MKKYKVIKKQFWMRHEGLDIYTVRPIKSKLLKPLSGTAEDMEMWHEVTIIKSKKH